MNILQYWGSFAKWWSSIREGMLPIGIRLPRLVMEEMKATIECCTGVAVGCSHSGVLWLVKLTEGRDTVGETSTSTVK